MKHKLLSILTVIALLTILSLQLSTVCAQSTAFTFQGRLNSGASPANGNYDMKFTLYGDPGLPAGGGPPIAGPVIVNPVVVSDGFFTVTIDFGSGVFQGQLCWLELGVRKQGETIAYQTLSPRQSITPTPYALFAPSAGVANNVLNTATVQGQSLNIGLGNQVSGAYGSVGGGINNIASGSLTVVAGGAGNVSSGMFGAVGGGSNNVANGNISVVAGGEGNQAVGDHAFVGGGYQNSALGPYNTVGGGRNNLADPSDSTVSGGSLNSATSDGAVVGGGNGNSATGNAATVSGGAHNQAIADVSTVGGGIFNTASGYAATVSGGYINYATSNYSTVGGGGGNFAVGQYATVPGGAANRASGSFSFAAGNRAKAIYDGAFVWADSQAADFSATANDQFCIRAQGGVQFAPPTSLSFGFSTRQMLNLYDVVYGIGVQDYTLYQRTAPTGGFAWYAGGIHNDSQNNSGGGATLMSLDSTGTLTVNALTIQGGADVAEPFKMSTAEIPKGAVVIIDEEDPGKLKLSDRAYDTRVAGVVSGAKEIHPGLRLQQQGALEGGQYVALTGRVYVQADASNGPIRPGDLLTTSAIPGDAMRVTDHGKAQGAILGKAMGSLKEGKGLVLVLVTLE